MLKKLIPALFAILLLASCSSVRPTASAENKPAKKASNPSATKGGDVKFLDDISVEAAPAPVGRTTSRREQKSSKASYTEAAKSDLDLYMNRANSVEKASALQLKYAILLDTEVEQLSGSTILEYVDEWYGTRYRMGGTTKSGIDCSAFVQNVYQSAFSKQVPRTAREQYKASRIISATELKEGDLVFFNTTGGVSHVGIYLRNNKFIHASSSQGVTVSDMFDPYYLKRYIGAGRISH